MKKESKIPILFFIILCAIGNIFLSVTFTVGNEGANFDSIKKAIAAARDGDTVFIFPGVYKENLRFQKSISIVGKERERVILKPENKSFPVVLAENCNSLLIEGLTIESEGIAISTAMTSATIRNNIIKTSSDGIRGGTLNHKIVIANNTFVGPLNYEYGSSGNSSNGIVLFGQGDTEITGNQIKGFEYGIYLSGKKPCSMKNNTLAFNNISMYLGGNTVIEMSGNVFTDSFLDGLIIGSKSEIIMNSNSFVSNKNWDIRFSGRECETGFNQSFTGKISGKSNKRDELSRICPDGFEWPEGFFSD